jgi:hypothetical protein
VGLTRELAMVLPLPVVRGAGDEAVRFIDLSGTPRMFDELDTLFEPPVTRQKGGFAPGLGRPRALVVHEVGAFVASYVPTRADFARLDPRFRLPDVLFDAVAHYADYGFATERQAGGLFLFASICLPISSISAASFAATSGPKWAGSKI